MPPLQVKDCPADIYEQLRACAAEENRSISQQTLTIIKDYLDRRAHPEACPSVGPGDSRSFGANLCYVNGVAHSNGIDYLAKRKATLERISKLSPIPISENSPSSVEILAQIREEEAR